jgi:hypothetical protein
MCPPGQCAAVAVCRGVGQRSTALCASLIYVAQLFDTAPCMRNCPAAAVIARSRLPVCLSVVL